MPDSSPCCLFSLPSDPVSSAQANYLSPALATEDKDVSGLSESPSISKVWINRKKTNYCIEFHISSLFKISYCSRSLSRIYSKNCLFALKWLDICWQSDNGVFTPVVSYPAGGRRRMQAEGHRSGFHTLLSYSAEKLATLQNHFGSNPWVWSHHLQIPESFPERTLIPIYQSQASLYIARAAVWGFSELWTEIVLERLCSHRHQHFARNTFLWYLTANSAPSIPSIDI